MDLARESLVVDVIERDDQTKLEITAKKLELTMKNHRPEWLIGKPNLTISNPDGQAPEAHRSSRSTFLLRTGRSTSGLGTLRAEPAA